MTVNNNIYMQRLIQFARYLYQMETPPTLGLIEKIVFVEFPSEEKPVYEEEGSGILITNLEYLHYVLDELPLCFPEWTWDEGSGDPTLGGFTDEERTVAETIDFFDMTLMEFVFCFAVNYQFEGDSKHYTFREQLKGKELNPFSSPSDVARNLIKIIRHRKKSQEI